MAITCNHLGGFQKKNQLMHIHSQEIEYDFHLENENLFLSNNPEFDGPILNFVRN